jgi:sulfatase maturation enzyme AslB (radical SAM superfamily)
MPYGLPDDLVALKRKGVLPWVPNKLTVELEITTSCSLACFNCDRSVRQAPSNERMSLEQIQKFIDESVEMNWKWKHIKLLGGEPTLHPQLFEILDMLHKYVETNSPDCVIGIATNGYGPKVNEVLSRLPNWVVVTNTRKKSNVQPFVSYNIAPIDLEEYSNSNFSRGCWITEVAGLGLTRYGYYPCGAGGALDRVFGFNIGVKTLKSVTDSALNQQLNLLCRYCGHYKTNYDDKRIFDEQISKSWKDAYEKYRANKPHLVEY